MNETDQMNPSGQSRSARLFIMIMPNMDRVDVLSLYRQMLLIRRFEEKSAEMYALAKIGGVLHLYIGEEAIAVGAIAPVRAGDYGISDYPDHWHCLAKGSGPRRSRAGRCGHTPC